METLQIQLGQELHRYILADELKNFENCVANHLEILKLPFWGSYDSILHYCAEKGKIPFCEIILQFGVPVDYSTKGDKTALILASRSTNLEMVHWLLQKGAQIDGLATSISTPLMNAIVMGNDAIVQLLIEKGANINRMHLRSHQTPLDLAIAWGRVEAQKCLKALNAVSIKQKIDWSTEYGGSILQYVNDTVGSVLPIQFEQIVGTSPVYLRMAIVNKGKNKLLFTSGLFAIHKPMLELFIVLPLDWNMNLMTDENQFPIRFLLKLVHQIENGLKITEGLALKASESVEDTLKYPNELLGFQVVDHYWGKTRDTKELTADDVTLLTLLPIKKKWVVKSIDKSRLASWSNLSLSSSSFSFGKGENG